MPRSAIVTASSGISDDGRGVATSSTRGADSGGERRERVEVEAVHARRVLAEHEPDVAMFDPGEREAQ